MQLPQRRAFATAGPTKENVPQVETVHGSMMTKVKVKRRVKAKEKRREVAPAVRDAEAPRIKTRKATARRRQVPINPLMNNENAIFSKKVPAVMERSVFTNTLKYADTMPKVRVKKAINASSRT